MTIRELLATKVGRHRYFEWVAGAQSAVEPLPPTSYSIRRQLTYFGNDAVGGAIAEVLARLPEALRQFAIREGAYYSTDDPFAGMHPRRLVVIIEQPSHAGRAVFDIARAWHEGDERCAATLTVALGFTVPHGRNS